MRLSKWKRDGQSEEASLPALHSSMAPCPRDTGQRLHLALQVLNQLSPPPTYFPMPAPPSSHPQDVPGRFLPPWPCPLLLLLSMALPWLPTPTPSTWKACNQPQSQLHPILLRSPSQADPFLKIAGLLPPVVHGSSQPSATTWPLVMPSGDCV